MDICKQMLASAMNGDDEPQSISFAVIIALAYMVKQKERNKERNKETPWNLRSPVQALA